MSNIDDLLVHESCFKKCVISLQNYFLKKGKKEGVKYRRNLKYLEKTNVLN